MKTCGVCTRDLEESCFNRKGNSLQHQCRNCQSEYRKKHYRENIEDYKSKAKAYDAKVKALVDSLKVNPCTDCGVSYPSYVMDFDHRLGEEKLFEIADAVNSLGYSIKRILPEIEKCDLVCANCHRIRTHQRFYSSS